MGWRIILKSILEKQSSMTRFNWLRIRFVSGGEYLDLRGSGRRLVKTA
jgi:hypothetical protein